MDGVQIVGCAVAGSQTGGQNLTERLVCRGVSGNQDIPCYEPTATPTNPPSADATAGANVEPSASHETTRSLRDQTVIIVASICAATVLLIFASLVLIARRRRSSTDLKQKGKEHSDSRSSFSADPESGFDDSSTTLQNSPPLDRNVPSNKPTLSHPPVVVANMSPRPKTSPLPKPPIPTFSHGMNSSDDETGDSATSLNNTDDSNDSTSYGNTNRLGSTPIPNLNNNTEANSYAGGDSPQSPTMSAFSEKRSSKAKREMSAELSTPSIFLPPPSLHSFRSRLRRNRTNSHVTEGSDTSSVNEVNSLKNRHSILSMSTFVSGNGSINGSVAPSITSSVTGSVNNGTGIMGDGDRMLPPSRRRSVRMLPGRKQGSNGTKDQKTEDVSQNSSENSPTIDSGLSAIPESDDETDEGSVEEETGELQNNEQGIDPSFSSILDSISLSSTRNYLSAVDFTTGSLINFDDLSSDKEEEQKSTQN
ncbi:hypothetical protein BKA69DRAFT_1037456 [Paraphysoderma sedebokerense]|nr:hypothetical protein BKA69DRAFT_1037456 [Paraphysoderma sedebokerense]